MTNLRSGEDVDGPRSVEWTGDDPEGDPLTYGVFYSPDGGRTWLPMGVGLDDPQAGIAAENLPADETVTIRVLASDGLNTSSAEVRDVHLQGTAPDECRECDPRDSPFPDSLLLAQIAALIVVAAGVVLLRVNAGRA